MLQQVQASQPALAILARQGDLVRIARQSTGDVNEAALMVHRVMSRAFQKYRAERADLPEVLRRDMQAALGGAEL
jgi:hypothetical protein